MYFGKILNREKDTEFDKNSLQNDQPLHEF